MTVRISQPLIYVLLTLQLAGCTVGPDYVRPEAKISNEFKESKGWKQAQPRDNVLSGKWWEIFNDYRLNQLEEQVATANQSIIQAEAQYRQAQHLVQSAQSAFFPIANLTGTTNRFRAASQVGWATLFCPPFLSANPSGTGFATLSITFL